MGRELGRELGRETGREMGGEMGREMGRETRIRNGKGEKIPRPPTTRDEPDHPDGGSAAIWGTLVLAFVNHDSRSTGSMSLPMAIYRWGCHVVNCKHKSRRLQKPCVCGGCQ